MQKNKTALLSYGMSEKYSSTISEFHPGLNCSVLGSKKKLIQQDYPNVISYATLRIFGI
jgi:hypothetical protein